MASTIDNRPGDGQGLGGDRLQVMDRLRAGGPAEIVAAARRVGAELAERAERHDREGSFAAENIEAIWAAGLGNVNLPVELGGLGADLTTTAQVVEALAMGDPSTALIFVMHLVHLRDVAAPDGEFPEHLRRRLIADSLAGPALLNALRVEPELGSPSRGGVPATVAVRGTDDDGAPVWRISGRKTYSTGSYGLTWMVVWGATAADDPEGQRTGSFLVAADTPGIEVVETWDHLGMRASASHDIVFRDVVIPYDHALDLKAAGGPAEFDAAQWSRNSVLLLRIYTGVAKAGRDWLAGYLNDRKPSSLGASLATLPRFQSTVGEIEALIFTADTLLTALATQLDAGGATAAAAAPRAGLVKVVVTGDVIKALESALALIGNPGLSYHHPLQRHYRNALCGRIHTPQDDVVLTAAGKAVLQTHRPESDV